MIARGFIVQFPSDAQQQTRSEAEPRFDSYKAKDLSSWLWSSIDNDDSKDLDQIEYALREATGTRIYIGIADVDWFVPYDSPLDHTAWQNTTSIYTGVVTFPMPPERTAEALSALAEHCTEKENDANKVERFVKKCAAAAILSKQIGAHFDAVVSGVNADGTWVRLRQPPVEGKLLIAAKGMDVGHRVRVRLVSADPERGFIDFQIA